MRDAAARGCRFVSVSPLRTDMPDESGAEWIAATPGTDTAMMLGVAYVLVDEDRHDLDFIAQFTDRLAGVRATTSSGRTDGTPKNAEWAAGVSRRTGEHHRTARTIAGGQARADRRLAFAAARRTRRAAGLDGSRAGGRTGPDRPARRGLRLCARRRSPTTATGERRADRPTLPQGDNGVATFIPVARIADMLLNPGDAYRYNGRRRTYPDIRLVYWAGGNPFHHHQDLTRLLARLRDGSTPSSSTRSPGPPPHATPISCCPAR